MSTSAVPIEMYSKCRRMWEAWNFSDVKRTLEKSPNLILSENIHITIQSRIFC